MMTNCAYVLELRLMVLPVRFLASCRTVEYFQTSICLDEHGSLIIKFMSYHPMQLDIRLPCLALFMCRPRFQILGKTIIFQLTANCWSIHCLSLWCQRHPCPSDARWWQPLNRHGRPWWI